MDITSLTSGTYFDDTFKKFFDTYQVTENVECYQISLSPEADGMPANGKSIDYLFENFPKYKFQTRVVILNIGNPIMDKFGQIDMSEIIKFCEYHTAQQFIIFNSHTDFGKIRTKKLYTEFINSVSDQIIHSPSHILDNKCQEKKVSNKWLFSNKISYEYMNLSKVCALYYLLSKDYYQNGIVSIATNSNHFVPANHRQIINDYYVPMPHNQKNIQKNKHNVSKIKPELKDDFKKGYERFLSMKNEVVNTDNDIHETVHNEVDKNIGVQIISGIRFFEQFPVVDISIIESTYAQNFPIYINGVGTVKWIEDEFGLDMFRDIVDHSYDEITDHFERLTAAIDRNAHLLDGSTNISELWHDNQKRFEDNCKKIDDILQEGTYRTNYNHEKIKKSLLHFGIDSVNN